MASDNTTLNPGSSGDQIRDIARQGGPVKTQVVQLDIGGDSANAEILISAGQKGMAMSFPVVLSSDHSALPVVDVPANNSFGEAIDLTAGATAALISIPATTPGFQIKGFIGSGTGDGYWFVQVGGVTLFSGRTRSTVPTLIISLPNGIFINTGSAVTLNVTNESGSTANFESTLLGA